MSKVMITCALNGVLTDPKQHSVPVTPAEMAAEAKRAYDAGASIMHIHLRQQGEGKGHLPSWDIALSKEVQAAIREACPGVIINHTTGTVGPDYQAALDVVTATRPEMAACNAGSLKYLKLKRDGSWAWPPMLFDNTPQKVQHFIDAITGVGAVPEFECFDTGIVRSVGMYLQAGLFSGVPELNFVMGVASGMPCDADLLALLPRWLPPGAVWQSTLIGRAEIWPVHQRTAELGGMLRTGLEDSFYLPGGDRAPGNGAMIEALARCARDAGRAVATPAETRAMLGLRAGA